MKNNILNRLVDVLPRDLLVDLTDMGVTKAREAHEIIRDHTTLYGKSARGAEGQIRFRIMEQGFQESCEKYGGLLLEGGLVEGSDLRIFQPFMRFSGEEGDIGVVLGLASMPAKGEMPVKNMSRRAGVSLNYNLTPRLALDESDPKPGDIFVLFLVARDPAKSGQIEEIAIGIIDSNYEDFLFYEAIEKFVARYAPPTDIHDDDSDVVSEPLVKLKTKRSIYIPPESDNDDDEKQEDDI